MLGHRFSVISTAEHSIPNKEALVRKYHLEGLLASIRLFNFLYSDLCNLMILFILLHKMPLIKSLKSAFLGQKAISKEKTCAPGDNMKNKYIVFSKSKRRIL